MVQQVADDSKLFNEVDYVGRDKIWSDYVKNEENSAKIWNGQWSFLKGKVKPTYVFNFGTDIPERKVIEISKNWEVL